MIRNARELSLNSDFSSPKERIFLTGIVELKSEIQDALVCFTGTSDIPGLPIYLSGESGVGKTLLAEFFHNSCGCSGNLISVNCPAISASLFISELLGSKKGSYTGSVSDSKGLLSQADQGVVFLDEISNLTLEQQAMLLRVIETGYYKPVGEDQERRIIARCICASNKDLDTMVHDGTFREDLLYRIRGYELRIPPLRKRMQDLFLLTEYFLNDFKRSPGQLCEDAKALLAAHNWPGNVRELKMVLQRAVLLARNGQIRKEHIKFDLPMRQRTTDKQEANNLLGVGMTLKEAESIFIKKTLESCNGNKTKAAKMLDITTRTLRFKMSSQISMI